MRLDVYLAENGMVKSRQRAKELITNGQVSVNGRIIEKPSFETYGNEEVSIEGEQLLYVGRGGLKLEKAVSEFGIDFKGKICIDIGASTGGFTDCMLRNGASFVYAVDVGHGQLDEILKNDPRVMNMEGTNILDLSYKDFSEIPDRISADVSFVSLKKIIPKIKQLLSENGESVVLIKPQFEAGRSAVGKGGIVKDKKVHENVIEDVLGFASSEGLAAVGLTFSPICGGDGNIEYLAYLKNSGNCCRIDCKKIVSDAFAALK